MLDHAIASGEALPYLSYGDFSFFGAALSQKFLVGPDFKRRVMHENTISIGLKAMALAGWGMAWLPESLIYDEMQRGELVRASTDSYWDLTVEIRIYRHDTPFKITLKASGNSCAQNVSLFQSRELDTQHPDVWQKTSKVRIVGDRKSSVSQNFGFKPALVSDLG